MVKNMSTRSFDGIAGAAPDRAVALEATGSSYTKTSGETEAEPQNVRQLYMTIGKFIFCFSQLEFLIRHALGEILKLDNERFYAVTPTYDFATLCRVTQNIYATAAVCGEQERAEIDELLKECLKLNEERVRIVHGTWFINDKELGTDHVSRSTLEPKTYYSRIEDIQKVIGELHKLTSRLIVFLTVSGVILRPTTSEAPTSPQT
jgi:hypothetical protein